MALGLSSLLAQGRPAVANKFYTYQLCDTWEGAKLHPREEIFRVTSAPATLPMQGGTSGREFEFKEETAMKKKIMSVVAMCMLAASLSFAQDTMKQQDNSKDQMQSGDSMKKSSGDSMKNGSSTSKKSSSKKKSSSGDSMSNDSMKKASGDNMSNDNMKNNNQSQDQMKH